MKNIFRKCDLALPEREYEIRLPSGRRAFIDFAYPQFKLGIEVDGYGPHSGLDSWRGDMRRENELKLLGWVVLHFSWEDVLYRPALVIAEIRVALAGACLF